MKCHKFNSTVVILFFVCLRCIRSFSQTTSQNSQLADRSVCSYYISESGSIHIWTVSSGHLEENRENRERKQIVERKEPKRRQKWTFVWNFHFYSFIFFLSVLVTISIYFVRFLCTHWMPPATVAQCASDIRQQNIELCNLLEDIWQEVNWNKCWKVSSIIW